MPKKPLPEGEARTALLQVRLSPAEKTELVAGAEALGVSAGALMRDAGLAAARHNKPFKPNRMKPRSA